MIRLPDTGPALRSVLPADRDIVSWHAALAAEIAARLSPAHAALLARPDARAGTLSWTADGGAAVRYGDLPEAARRQLDAALGAVLSDIRRLADSGTAPALRAAWPALREIPDMGHVFAVDGRPVLAGWGHLHAADPVGASARLARLDDGVPFRARPRAPWGLYAATALVLLLLGAGAGLLLPGLAARLLPAPAACTTVPGQLEAMRRQATEDSRGAELRTLLATLTEEIGRKQLQCPVPTAPAPRPPAQPPAQPPRADLPQDRWERRDLSLLEGCWTLTSSMTVTNESRNESSPVTTWRMCFDGQGSGRQTIALENGKQCAGPLAAAFAENDALRVTEPENCRGSFNLNQSVRLCRRVSDSEAICEGRAVAGARAGVLFTGRFRR